MVDINEASSKRVKELLKYTGRLELKDNGGSLIVTIYSNGNKKTLKIIPYNLEEFKDIREEGEDVVVDTSIIIKGLKKEMEKFNQSKKI